MRKNKPAISNAGSFFYFNSNVFNFYNNRGLAWFGLSDLPDFQQYFSYIVAVSFIGGGNHRPAVSH
jgi:hypothetical protein